MPGIAIKILGANYSASGLGRVTLKGSAVPITAIAINGDDSITNSGQYTAALTPSNSTQTNVVWSITSGSTYATIDKNGLVTAKAEANNNNVTIKCASADNPSVYATKTIRVSYVKAVTAITVSGPSSVTDTGQFSAKLTPSDTTQTGVAWSITSGGSYASIDQKGLVTAKDGANNSNVTIKCTSSANSSVFATKTITVTKSSAQPSTGLVTDGLIRNYDAFGATSTSLNDLTRNGDVLSFAGSHNTNTVGNNRITAPANEEYTNAKGQQSSAFLNNRTKFTLEMVVLTDGWVGTDATAMKDIYHDVSTSEMAGRMIINMAKLSGSSENGYIAIRKPTKQWQICQWSESTLDIDWSVPHVLDFTAEIVESQVNANFYLDGELFATAQTTIAISSFYCADAVFLMSDLTQTQRSLFAIRCYDKVLTAGEVLQNYEYNADRYGFENNKQS